MCKFEKNRHDAPGIFPRRLDFMIEEKYGN